MKPLSGVYSPPDDFTDSLVDGFRLQSHEEADPETLRDGLKAEGYTFEKLKPGASKASFLAADSSTASLELRYHALWAAHAVALYAIFDGGKHPDLVVGHSSLPYGGILSSSYLDIAEIIPYSDVDARCGLRRVVFEFESLAKALSELKGEGIEADYLLIDGSLQTTRDNLSSGANLPERPSAEKAFRRVLDSGKAVGMVEDSHSCDISAKLGYNFTNMLLFELALKPGEYVARDAEGIHVCHVKLPGKRLPYLPSGESRPLTARWEFNFDRFQDALNTLAGIWLSEDDLLHPQLYPVRLADHLTRKLSVAGLLEKVGKDRGLEPKYRELREG